MQPLAGVRVVELSVWVAGPSTGGMLADWGADVVKVEPPAGDPYRHVFATSGLDASLPAAPFAMDNRGKRSVVLDLQVEEGREVLDRLLGEADIFVTNLRPAALGRLGLGHAEVLERHPRLVYGLVTGYGIAGPEKERPGYDIGAFWARSGLAMQSTAKDDAPQSPRSAQGDHTTGLAALGGILAALHHRDATGEGILVEVSLQRTGMYCLGVELGVQLVLGRVTRAVPRTESASALLNSYRAGDDRWFFLIGLEADRHFPGVVVAAERPDLLEDERFNTPRGRLKNRRELIAELDEAFARQPLSEWARRFDAADVWWAPAQTAAEVVEDRQAIETGAFVEIEGGETPALTAVAPPAQFGGEALGRTGPVPGLGQHTDEVLSSLGYDDEARLRLRKRGATV